MIVWDQWDYSVKGREITRDSSLHQPFSPELIASVGGAEHSDYVEFAQRLEGTLPQVIGMYFPFTPTL